MLEQQSNASTKDEPAYMCNVKGVCIVGVLVAFCERVIEGCTAWTPDVPCVVSLSSDVDMSIT